VGAVFNRDYPFNRGWKPLPPTINFNLNDIDFMKFHISAAAGLKSGQFNQEKNFIFVINGVVSYEGLIN